MNINGSINIGKTEAKAEGFAGRKAPDLKVAVKASVSAQGVKKE